MTPLIRRVLAALLALIAGHAASSTASAQVDRDERDWRAATAANTCEAFERYLELHPLGRYSGEAFQRAVECARDIGPPDAGSLEDQDDALGDFASPPY
jgi:hypothetical protein